MKYLRKMKRQTVISQVIFLTNSQDWHEIFVETRQKTERKISSCVTVVS